MYRRGVPYFDYLTGLTVAPAAVASILRPWVRTRG